MDRGWGKNRRQATGDLRRRGLEREDAIRADDPLVPGGIRSPRVPTPRAQAGFARRSERRRFGNPLRVPNYDDTAAWPSACARSTVSSLVTLCLASPNSISVLSL